MKNIILKKVGVSILTLAFLLSTYLNSFVVSGKETIGKVEAKTNEVSVQLKKEIEDNNLRENVVRLVRGTLTKNAGAFQVEGGTSGTEWTYANNTLTFKQSGTYTVTGDGNQTSDSIVVSANFTGQIKIENINIDSSDCAFLVDDSADLTLMLEGTNTLLSADNKAGLEFSDATTGSLTINSETNGSLTAVSDLNGAGIGGGLYRSGNNITINGGTVTAISGLQGAGIGGGYYGSGNTITINGGTVTAISGRQGAGIGGGNYGSGNTITINGGTVTAISGHQGAGIGGGYSGSGNNITINEGIINANGGFSSAGIGGGYYMSGNDITINGGTITAIGGEFGTGIGSGYFANQGDVTITGGILNVNASSNSTSINAKFFTTESGDAVIYINYDNETSKAFSDETNKNECKALIFDNKKGTVYGDILSVNEDFEIPTDHSLVIDNGKTLFIESNAINKGSLQNEGTLTINGSLENTGTLEHNGTSIDGSGTLSGTGEFLKPLSSNTEIKNILNSIYTGSAIEPTIEYISTKIMNIDFVYSSNDYTKSYENNINAGTGKVIFTNKTNPNKKIEKTFVIEKAIPITPNLEKQGVTGTSITIKPLLDTAKYGKAQYSLDNVKWQDSNVFNGLTGLKEYTIYAKYSGTTNYKESIAKKIKITTPESETQILERAKALADKAISEYKATNNTTKEDMHDLMKGAIVSINGVDVKWKEDPIINKSTWLKEGSISGNVILTMNLETIELSLNKTIQKVSPIIYKVIKGQDSKYTQGANDGLKFTLDSDSTKFIELQIEGKTIDKKYYIVESGSTIITLYKEYLNTLKEGSYKVTAMFKDGYSDIMFTVKEKIKPINPDTSDTTNANLYISLIALSGLIILLIRKKSYKVSK